MKKTFNIKTLGCKVNQYESEAIEELFKKRGFEKKEENADIYVINTCTVTNMSDRKSRQTISKARKENKDAIIAVIGCYSQVKADEVKKIDGVDIILGSRNKEEVVDLCENFIKNNKKMEDVEEFSIGEAIEDLEISNQSDMTRAYIKIQDGCNMYCSYCLIPYARGNIASRDLVSIIDEAKRLRDNAYKEIVLTGIHVASYGKDFDLDISLIDVIEHIAKIDGIERIRLSSMEPRHIDREFLQRMKDTKKACDHFHLSLQSGSDDVLKLMNRKYTTKVFKEKVDLIREYFPNAGLTTDIIVGFPNESEKNHEETKNFVKDIKFSKTHLFKYSKRDGTKAASMKNQVDGNIKKRRSKELSEIEKEISHEFLDKQIGKTLSVLFETKTELDGYRSGYSTNYLRVHSKDRVEINEIKNVKITRRIDDYLIGDIVD
ncbi:tRNA (N(6)-L-threonylcarbamoyladenosine(37)-C(2))-methylthiotransferase MtaB [Anaerococcus vaginalis]|uniref:tRNA (N(6)-L-threonylcarbamoyladenosine(37)-C(2))- methylthiotransferase MtaB n=1 Tax=Anaerococcus vaginalis TaxID=33037 RepID=UPI0029046CCE|nr:tRNA (N(6)-L-threonylcarbamoyladenosine(37)-C(2))-methylthiotransferase MtaB [Anaerococcus vaginalis]MDU2648179.1 tRNA (N(6)-L-threonylcarbamoyladenosine(37)-C(2))-methylthiotransferase MtaB [Anaerococcus vaginalis]